MSLCAVVALVMASNYVGQYAATVTSNTVNLIVSAPLVALSILLVFRNGIRGNFGRAWIFFAAFAVLWFTAERIWTLYELVYQVSPWPSEADFFWLAGYPPYFAFAFFYMRSFGKSISAKLVAAAVATVLMVLAFIIYATSEEHSGLSDYERALALSYPVADAISLLPIVLALGLFFRGQVNLMWSLMFLGMQSFAVADLGFTVLSLDSKYYTGHPVDIPYFWGYILLLFGLCSHLQIFRKRGPNNQFNNQDGMR